ncbi:hypothetical protein KFK09_029125 [Dendrobium nobile]|uniref:DUF4283 domain-containing protein n=1 Tax=Dendrobium nobile TaxID=94219 RepID=A0A8T3A9R0_DENNO|nr:hypothetical protein KFK09_029125 [Dendrobium nobile]
MADKMFPSLPTLPSSTISSPSRPSVLPLWKNLLTTTPQISSDFSHSLSYTPTQNFTANFTADQYVAGAPEWSLSLVGYSIGKRPFYEALLSTIKKAWQLEGELSLLTMDDGFFLLKFTALEDYEHAWTGGPWFFFGKPFILQKWSPDFIPKREEFPSIPLWIKIMNLPLSLRTPEGISKLASCVGIPNAVDALTAAKTRLTFARVCIQVTSNSPLPEEIFFSIDGKITPLRVHYDWKPEHCSQCGSIMHPPTLCPKDPITKPISNNNTRGRSSSRNTRPSPPPRLTILKPPLQTKPPLNNDVSAQPPNIHPPTKITTSLSIPNLNSPSGELQDSTDMFLKTTAPKLIITSNKFQTLGDADPIDVLQPQNTSLVSSPTRKNQTPTTSTKAHNTQNQNSQPQTSARFHQSNIPPIATETSGSSSSSSTVHLDTNQNKKTN